MFTADREHEICHGRFLSDANARLIALAPEMRVQLLRLSAVLEGVCRAVFKTVGDRPQSVRETLTAVHLFLAELDG